MMKYKIAIFIAVLAFGFSYASASWICGEVSYQNCEFIVGDKVMALNLSTQVPYERDLWDSDPPQFWMNLPEGNYKVWIKLSACTECDRSSAVNVTAGRGGALVYLTVYGDSSTPY